MAEIIVLGAGPAGLSAALDAAESGHRCTLLEASSAVGGMAGSFEFAGQRVDFGSHRLHFALADRHRARFERLLGDDLQVRPRNGRIRLRNRWIGFPLRTWDLLTHVPPSFGLRVAADVVTGPLRRTPGTRLDHPSGRSFDTEVRTRQGALDRAPGRSFDTEIRARLGNTVADEFYGPYARKLYGVKPTELDAELARRRVSATGAGDVLRRMVRAAGPSGRQFLYPRHGYGQLSEALAAAAVDAGVGLRLHTAATAVTLSGKGVAVHVRRDRRQHGDASGGSPDADPSAAAGVADGVDEALHADAVWSTLPISTLASIVEPGPPEPILEAVARCRMRSMVLAYLVLKRDQYTPFDAHYFPENNTRVARLSEPKNYRDGDDPAGQTVLCAEIPCWPDDDLWRADDASVAQQAISDLEASELPAVDPSEIAVRRLASVYPVFEQATMPCRAAVAGWLTSLTSSGLISLGRQGLAALDNLHHVLDMGADAAAALTPSGDIDAAAWLSSLDRYVQHIVED